MQLTLSDAIDELAGANGAYSSSDLKTSINKAIRALAKMKGWQCLRKVVRFSSVGPCFTLPQGCAGLVRVCVNGCPTTVRGQDFRFLQSGPGDVPFGKRIPKGFTMVSNAVDLGQFPIMTEPASEFRVFAYKDSAADAKIKITGIDITGRRISVTLEGNQIYTWPEYDADGTITSGTEIEDADPSAVVFAEITEVVIDPSTKTTITLYAADAMCADKRFPIAQYDKRVKVPKFHRYELPNIKPGQPVELLAEVRIDPLPLIDLDDVLPFDSTEPIEYMIRAEWAMRSTEASQADKYRTAAANWLLAQEIADDTKQTQFMINSVMTGSPGEISMEAENI